jgi:hypothetical protein
MKKLMWGIVFFLIAINTVKAQADVQIGSSLIPRNQSQGAYFDYSDPEAINIKVSVWGFVKYPGRYLIPSYSNVNDLLSYAGGPTDDSELKQMSLIRTNADSSQSIINLDYNDILFDEQMKVLNRPPQVVAGDILLVPGEPRLYFKDYFSITLSVFSALISLGILILNIVE